MLRMTKRPMQNLTVRFPRADLTALKRHRRKGERRSDTLRRAVADWLKVQQEIQERT